MGRLAFAVPTRPTGRFTLFQISLTTCQPGRAYSAGMTTKHPLLIVFVLAAMVSGCAARSTAPVFTFRAEQVPLASGEPGGQNADGQVLDASAPDAQQPQRPASRAERMWAGAIIGAVAGAVLASTVGQEACLGKPRWHCTAMGGSYGAVIGILVTRK